jgi:MoaA/NifB/PqqE/SkfB family radical SAM enzyme
VQFIKFQHNADEVDDAARWCRAHGVDQVTDYWGNLHNYVDVAPQRTTVTGARQAGALPHCAWPYFAMQVKYDGDAIPCCYHRVSEQYRTGGDARVVGNVFDDGVRAVWTSPTYRALRRLVVDPRSAESDPASAESFCHGCDVVYETDTATRTLTADANAWETVYLRSPAGRVVRR